MSDGFSSAWIGLGAIGQEVLALCLPALRRREEELRFVLVDRDLVTADNHHLFPRTYPRDFIERPKTVLAAWRVAEGLSETDLTVEQKTDVTRLGLTIFQELDLIVACLDNRMAQRALSDAVFLSGSRAVTIFLNCDASRGGAQAVVLQAQKTGCLPESWSGLDHELVARAAPAGCGQGREAASASPESAALAASLGTWLIRRILQGDQDLVGTDTRMSFQDRMFKTFRHPRLDKDCPHLDHGIELGNTRLRRLHARPEQVTLERLAAVALDEVGRNAMICLRPGQQISVPHGPSPILAERYLHARRLRGIDATLAQLGLDDPREAFLVLDHANGENRVFITF